MYISKFKLHTISDNLNFASDRVKDSYSTHQFLCKYLFRDESRRNFLFREEENLKEREITYYIVSENKPILNVDYPEFEIETKIYSPAIKEGELLSFNLRANPTISKTVEGKARSKKHDIVMNSHHVLLENIATEININISSKQTKSNKINILLTALNLHENYKGIDKLKTIINNSPVHSTMLQNKVTVSELLYTAMEINADNALKKWIKDKEERYGFKLIEIGNSVLLSSDRYMWNTLTKKGKNSGYNSIDYKGQLEVTNTDLFKKLLFEGVGRAKAFGCGLILIQRIRN